MSQSLYLVRRDLETIFGPMTPEEFQNGFDHMKFGLQDEIAGHCSRWVVLENSAMLKKYYPEIYEFVYQNLRTWSNGISHKIQDISPENNRKHLWKILLLLLLVILAGAGGGFWAYKNDWVQFNIPDSKSALSVEHAVSLLKNEKISTLAKKMKTELPAIVESVQHSAGINEPWMPVIRWYAFHGNGSVPGISPQVLRGNIDAFIPGDCSQEAWKKQIQASLPQWKLLLKSQTDTADLWSRLLAWDPHWIRRRPQSGWVKPESFISACIYSALKGFYSIAAEDEFMKQILLTHKAQSTFIIHSIKNRLAWMSFLVNGTARPTLAFDRQNMDLLTRWSCMEFARTREKLNQCYDFLNSPAHRDNYHDYRYIMNFIRLTLSEDEISPQELSAISDKMLDVSLLDAFTGFDYRAELAFLRQLVKENGNVYRSLQRVRVEFPTVNLTRDYQW